MTEAEKILSNFTDEQRRQVEQLIALSRKEWVEELKPKPNAFGLRNLPRENPDDPSSPFLRVFKTEKHTYTDVSDLGLSPEYYSAYTKIQNQRYFARTPDQLKKELLGIQHTIGSEMKVSEMRIGSITAIQGLLDAVADLNKEQFDASLWLCTTFILREDETLVKYSPLIAEEKVKDWSESAISMIDFFLLSGRLIHGYSNHFNMLVETNQKIKQRYLDAILTERSLSRAEKGENEKP